jgi:hypothetical protein
MKPAIRWRPAGEGFLRLGTCARAQSSVAAAVGEGAQVVATLHATLVSMESDRVNSLRSVTDGQA